VHYRGWDDSISLTLTCQKHTCELTYNRNMDKTYIQPNISILITIVRTFSALSSLFTSRIYVSHYESYHFIFVLVQQWETRIQGQSIVLIVQQLCKRCPHRCIIHQVELFTIKQCMSPNCRSYWFMTQMTAMTIWLWWFISVKKLVKKLNMAPVAFIQPARPSLYIQVLNTLFNGSS
jgi:hypothetical protein